MADTFSSSDTFLNVGFCRIPDSLMSLHCFSTRFSSIGFDPVSDSFVCLSTAWSSSFKVFSLDFESAEVVEFSFSDPSDDCSVCFAGFYN